MKLGEVHKKSKWMKQTYLSVEHRLKKETLKIQRGEWIAENIVFLNQQKMGS